MDLIITKPGQQLAPCPNQNIMQKWGLQRAGSEWDKLLWWAGSNRYDISVFTNTPAIIHCVHYHNGSCIFIHQWEQNDRASWCLCLRNTFVCCFCITFAIAAITNHLVNVTVLVPVAQGDPVQAGGQCAHNYNPGAFMQLVCGRIVLGYSQTYKKIK